MVWIWNYLSPHRFTSLTLGPQLMAHFGRMKEALGSGSLLERVTYWGRSWSFLAWTSLSPHCFLSVAEMWPASLLTLSPASPGLLLHLSRHAGLCLSKPGAQISPFSLKLLLSGLFYHSDKKVTKTGGLKKKPCIIPSPGNGHCYYWQS